MKKNETVTTANGTKTLPSAQETVETLGNRPIKKFKVLRPGGNETVLIEGIIDEQEMRTKINNRVMGAYNNQATGLESIEQVGFVNYSKENPQLMMAGGEFCGNATRSFAYDYLDGKAGEFEVQVSGVDRKLKAGVSGENSAWAEMPIYNDPEKIKEDTTNPGNYIVEMQGITHYVNNNGLPFELEDPDFSKKIKEHAMNMIREKGLENYPASGIMYVNRIGDRLQMIPVVYVKSIDTLFLETACGSGTTALGLVESKKLGTSINNLEVSQYSGVPIYISVEQNEGGEFLEAKIDGPITKLGEGSINTMSEKDIVIDRCTNTGDLEYAFKHGLIQLYQKLFSEAPYFEKYTDDEVKEIFNEYAKSKNNGIYFAKNEGNIIGFGVVVSIEGSSVDETLSEKISELGRDKEKCYYMADLGVDPSFQRASLGTDLVLSRINGLPSGSIVIMRTSLENYKSQGLYNKLGFQRMENITENVSQARINETKSGEDTRLFLYGVK